MNLDRFKIYKRNGEGGGMYELRVWVGNRWESSIFVPTLQEAKNHAYMMLGKDCAYELEQTPHTTEGSGELVWTCRDQREMGV